MAKEFTYKIIEHIGVISNSTRGWNKELNLISWNEAEPKYDIRDWSKNHEKMGKGITLSTHDLQRLKAILEDMNID